MAGIKINVSRIGLISSAALFIAGFLAGLTTDEILAVPSFGRPPATVASSISGSRAGYVSEPATREETVGGASRPAPEDVREDIPEDGPGDVLEDALLRRQRYSYRGVIDALSPAPAFAADLEYADEPAPAPTPAPTLPPMPLVAPGDVGMRQPSIDRIDSIVQRSLDQALFPGAVVLVARQGDIVKHSAYGYAALYAGPGQRLADPALATTDTIYDLASLSKLFTAVAIMKLVELETIDLDAPVAEYIPEFGVNGKSSITIRHLLSHTSGLPEGLQLFKRGNTREERLSAVFQAALKHLPGARRLYSDVGFITLGALVERMSGVRLDEFVKREILEPLQMNDTMYNPPPELIPRIAATERQPVTGRGMLRGQVHDNDAFSLDGVAGNAGVFSTARDLAVFAQMILDGGQYAGVRILSESTVDKMLTLQSRSPNGETSSLGWDVSQFWYMGSLASSGSAVGHTGYTGTSLVIDRASKTIVILLTNRVHPSATTSVNATRRDVANAVAESLP